MIFIFLLLRRSKSQHDMHPRQSQALSRTNGGSPSQLRERQTCEPVRNIQKSCPDTLRSRWQRSTGIPITARRESGALRRTRTQAKPGDMWLPICRSLLEHKTQSLGKRKDKCKPQLHCAGESNIYFMSWTCHHFELKSEPTYMSFPGPYIQNSDI